MKTPCRHQLHLSTFTALFVCCAQHSSLPHSVKFWRATFCHSTSYDRTSSAQTQLNANLVLLVKSLPGYKRWQVQTVYPTLQGVIVMATLIDSRKFGCTRFYTPPNVPQFQLSLLAFSSSIPFPSNWNIPINNHPQSIHNIYSSSLHKEVLRALLLNLTFLALWNVATLSFM